MEIGSLVVIPILALIAIVVFQRTRGAKLIVPRLRLEGARFPQTVRSRAGMKPLSQSRIERNGLKPGSIAPDFTLADIYGHSIALEQYRGQRILVVFSDPRCGPCNDLAPQLVRSYRRRRPDAANIIVVSRGERDENLRKAEEHGFEFPVVIQDRWKLSRKYGIFATPVAFLIGVDGRTIGEVAVGFDQILVLLRKEFKRGPIDWSAETVGEVSRILSSPIPRREAFRIAGAVVAGALFSAVGLQWAAFAACPNGFSACGSACCDGTQTCCNAATNLCCSTSLICCSGKCCAPTEVCVAGKCRQQVQP